MKIRTEKHFPLQSLLCTPESLRIKYPPVLGARRPFITAVDLFCGCGGLSFGAMQAAAAAKFNFRVDFALDNSASALAIYQKNFEKLAKVIANRDIEELVDVHDTSIYPTTKEISAWAGANAVDILIAGPPCQGHSDLNNSSRRFDPRNSLYLAPARVAVNLRPKVVLIENVPTVVRSKEDVVGQSRLLLNQLGYHVVELNLDLTRFGVPQTRTRHIQLASLKPLDELTLDIGRFPKKSVECLEFIDDLVDEASTTGNPFSKTTKLSPVNAERINYLFENSIFDLPNSLRPKCHREREHSYISMYGRIDPKKPAQTITSGFGSMGQGRFVHPTRPRMITAHEAARLQGFPDSFNFSGWPYVTALREMIGNAVSPTMANVLVQLLIFHGHFD